MNRIDINREELARQMTEKFLRWKLPGDFSPDAGISFKSYFNVNTEFQGRHEPSGTNLLNYDQALDLMRHLLDETPILLTIRTDSDD